MFWTCVVEESPLLMCEPLAWDEATPPLTSPWETSRVVFVKRSPLPLESRANACGTHWNRQQVKHRSLRSIFPRSLISLMVPLPDSSDGQRRGLISGSTSWLHLFISCVNAGDRQLMSRTWAAEIQWCWQIFLGLNFPLLKLTIHTHVCFEQRWQPGRAARWLLFLDFPQR